jgi:hypothetical protein
MNIYPNINLFKKNLFQVKKIITFLKKVPSATVDFNEMQQVCITVYKQPHQFQVNIQYIHIFKQLRVNVSLRVQGRVSVRVRIKLRATGKGKRKNKGKLKGKEKGIGYV